MSFKPLIQLNQRSFSFFSRRRRFFQNQSKFTQPVLSCSSSTTISSSPPLIFRSPIRSFFCPLFTAHETESPAALREILTTIGSNTGLTSAILGGISVSALLASSSITPAATVDHIHMFDFIDLSVIEKRGWGMSVAYPSLLVSTFLSLQNIVVSLCVSSYAWAIPLSKVPNFVKNHYMAIAAAGWLVVPNLAALAFGLLGLTENQWPAAVPFALAGFFALGLVSTTHTGLLLYSVYQLRKDYFLEKATQSSSHRRSPSQRKSSFKRLQK